MYYDIRLNLLKTSNSVLMGLDYAIPCTKILIKTIYIFYGVGLFVYQ